MEVACWAHVQRKFHGTHVAGATSPLARKALERIGELYAIEERIKDKPPNLRMRTYEAGGRAFAGRLQALA